MEVQVSVTMSGRGMTTKQFTNVVTAAGEDVIEVSLPASSTDVEVDICPGAVEGDLKIVHISASAYSEDLSYKIHADTNPAILLEEPHLYQGKQDSVSSDPFDKIFLSNAGDEAVTVSIFVARNVTPTP